MKFKSWNFSELKKKQQNFYYKYNLLTNIIIINTKSFFRVVSIQTKYLQPKLNTSNSTKSTIVGSSCTKAACWSLPTADHFRLLRCDVIDSHLAASATGTKNNVIGPLSEFSIIDESWLNVDGLVFCLFGLLRKWLCWKSILNFWFRNIVVFIGDRGSLYFIDSFH